MNNIINRDCGECSECCCFFSDNDAPCEYLDLELPVKRCRIYNNRPERCSNFVCYWRAGFGLYEERPDTSGILIFISNLNNGPWIYVCELRPNAVLDNKVMIAEAVLRFDFPAIICSYGSDNKGDLTIVKESLMYRARHMMGNLVTYLDENESLGIYEIKKVE